MNLHFTPTTAHRHEPDMDSSPALAAGGLSTESRKPRTAWRTRLKTLAAGLGLLATVIAAPAANSTIAQPVGIPAGTSVVLGSSGRGVAGGYCLFQNGYGAPRPGSRLQAITGDVALHDDKGGVRKMPLAGAMARGLISISFPPVVSGIRVGITATQGITRVEFLSNTAVGDDSVHLDGIPPAQRQAGVDRVLAGYSPRASASSNQQAIWERELEWIPVHQPGATTRTYRTWTADPTNHLAVSFARLPTQADASVIQTPGGRYLLHDQGGSKEATLAAIRQIPLKDGVRRVAVVIFVMPLG